MKTFGDLVNKPITLRPAYTATVTIPCLRTSTAPVCVQVFFSVSFSSNRMSPDISTARPTPPADIALPPSATVAPSRVSFTNIDSAPNRSHFCFIEGGGSSDSCDRWWQCSSGRASRACQYTSPNCQNHTRPHVAKMNTFMNRCKYSPFIISCQTRVKKYIK